MERHMSCLLFELLTQKLDTNAENKKGAAVTPPLGGLSINPPPPNGSAGRAGLKELFLLNSAYLEASSYKASPPLSFSLP